LFRRSITWPVKNVTDRVSNPFGMSPPCERFVPGYGDANADFHVVGDHPGVHGGAGPDDPAVPFTNEAGRRLQRALVDAGLLERAGDEPLVDRTFLSYLHACVPAGPGHPTEDDYGDMERFFDAELRAIGAHVLVPVGARATRHVLEAYTTQSRRYDVATGGAMDDLHGRELRGSGWLVVPSKAPAEWDADAGDDAPGSDHRRLVAGLRELQRTDFRRESDLGRFFPGDDSWFVR
jgi:uracil-DNA glycosylase family 4